MPNNPDSAGPVVVGVDGSEASIHALRHAMDEARWRGTALHVLNALDVTAAVLHLKGDVTITTGELAHSDRQEVWNLIRPIFDPSIEVVEVEREGSPVRALTDYCEEVGASVVVVGPRGRGRVTETLLGSTARGVVEKSHCNVLVVKARGR